MTFSLARLAVVITLTSAAGCAGLAMRGTPETATLKDAFASSFLVGAAIVAVGVYFGALSGGGR